jgi:enoyl-CoA hydratase
MTGEPEVLFEERGRAGVITLNRPRALNALTLSMIRKIHSRLLIWADNRRIERVVIRGAGERAFCAGGDIRVLRDWGLAGNPNAVAFYREEYRLNAFIKHYPKPCVALVNGIVMGGGVGVAVHGSHRICSERTVFAMPETGIGLFPDVGATFFLPRLPGFLGTYLALTGARLGQSDLEWSGIATHAVPSGSFDSLVDDLAEDADLDAAFARHVHSAGKPAFPDLVPVIDRCFGAASVQGIVARLNQVTGEHAAWAAETAASLQAKSPLSLCIAFRQMFEGRQADFHECLRIEFRIVNRVLNGSDFYEGVRAVIIDKDNRPQWSNRNLNAVGQSEVDRYFAPLGPSELEFS